MPCCLFRTKPLSELVRMSIGPQRINFTEIWNKTWTFSLKNMHWKILSVNCWLYDIFYLWKRNHQFHFDSLVQDCSISIAKTLEILLSYYNPSICSTVRETRRALLQRVESIEEPYTPEVFPGAPVFSTSPQEHHVGSLASQESQGSQGTGSPGKRKLSRSVKIDLIAVLWSPARGYVILPYSHTALRKSSIEKAIILLINQWLITRLWYLQYISDGDKVVLNEMKW